MEDIDFGVRGWLERTRERILKVLSTGERRSERIGRIRTWVLRLAIFCSCALGSRNGEMD